MNYWKKHYNENAVKFKGSLLKQVDMTVDGQEVGIEQVESRVYSIREKLSLNNNDVLLDVCCGNGMITKELSKSVKKIFAVDFSEGLIDVAKTENNSQNISYEVGDITKINFESFGLINKVNIYSGLQCITLVDLEVLFEKISQHSRSLVVYAANIPDKERIWDYYDTEEKREYYEKRESEGRPHMGTWYYKDDIEKMAKSLGLELIFLKIDSKLNTSTYRFDIMIKNIK